jgi:hypothetical protein
MISDRGMASTLKDHIRNPDTSHPLDLTDMKQQLSRFNEMFNEEAYRPSLSAALIITAPLQLLNIALGSLLTGFGIYFGFVYSAKLPTIGDHHSALAVLVVYITSAASGLLFFYIPVLIKRAATMRDQKDGGDAAELVDMLEIAIQATQRGDAATKQRSEVTQPPSKMVHGLRLTRLSAFKQRSCRTQPLSKTVYCLRLPGSSASKRSS